MHSISLFTMEIHQLQLVHLQYLDQAGVGVGNHLNWNQKSILSYQGSKYSTNCAACDASLFLRSSQLHGSYYDKLTQESRQHS